MNNHHERVDVDADTPILSRVESERAVFEFIPAASAGRMTVSFHVIGRELIPSIHRREHLVLILVKGVCGSFS